MQPFGEIVENRDSLRVPVKEADRNDRHGPYSYYGSVGVIDHIDDFIFEGEHLLISEDGKHLESRNRPIACIANGKFWVNNHAHVLRSNGKADLHYLSKVMEMRPIRQFVTGIDQFKLNRKSMDRIPIPVPPIELQVQYSQLRAKIDTQRKLMNSASALTNDSFESLSKRAFCSELA